jgi:hypothetical protein
MHGTIDLPALRRAADLLPATLDEEDRSIEVVWSSGARVRRQPLFGEVFDEELSMDPGSVRLDRLNAGGPLLKVHDTRTLDAVIGSVVPGTARIDQGRGIARVRFSQRADVEPIWADIRAGHLRAVSIGYQVHRFEVSRPANAPELWRAVDWTPFEISAVPVGADPAAGFRAVENLTPCVVDRDDVSSNERTPMDETITTPAPAPIAAPPEAVTRAPAPDADTKTLIAEAQSAERERVATILDLTGRLGLERALADDLVARGVELDEARRVILDKVAARSEETRSFAQVATPLGGRDERLTRREAVTNALLHRYSPSLFSLDEPARSYRGMTLLELSREFLTSAGVNVRGMSRDEIATRALHSTSDFPEILAAVTNKTLRQAYEAYPQTFRPFCRQVQASDFRDIARVQLGEAPQLQKVSESGEFKRGTIGEARERYRVETYGRVVGITRQTIINDDLDAFTRLPAMYGTAIATLESDIVWAIVVSNPTMGDGTALFHATHRNLAATGAMLSTASIGDARAAMAKQTGIDKKTVLNIRPSFLLVPVALELAAEQLLAQNIVPAKMADVVPQSIRSLAVIAEPRLDSASVNAWFLAASPAQIDTIEYAYLEGQQGAYIETRNGFDVDGVEIKCRLDFGAKAIDWRGLYRNPGA